jgi:hypothetical protein
MQQIPAEEFSFQVSVEIQETTLKEDTFGKYVSYVIKGADKYGEFVCTRRYKEFNLLREQLISRWPGCYVPPLPPKQSSVYSSF